MATKANVSNSNNLNDRLGRGLNALMTQRNKDLLSESNVVKLVSLRRLKQNPYQPRVFFDDEKLLELADSIRAKGILQPIIVKKDGERYIIVIGERRFRAAKLAGIRKIPVIEKDVNDQDMVELAVLENIQREDLSPIEEANAYSQLVNDFKMKLQDIAQKIGRSVSYISNKIRLLKLSDEVIRAVSEKRITEGHARAILILESKSLQLHILRIIEKNELSVREAEKLAGRLKIAQAKGAGQTRKIIRKVLTSNAKLTQNELKGYFSLPARIIPLKSGGKIVIRYRNDDDLARVCKLIRKRKK